MVANALTVSSDTPNLYPLNGGAEAAFGPIVGAAADLGTGVSLTSPVVVGEPIGYQVVTTNAGPGDAVDVVVVDVLPVGVSGAVGVPDPNISGGSCATAGQTVTCTYPQLPVGRKITTTLTGVVDEDLQGRAVLANTATSGSSTADPNTANDAASTGSTAVGLTATAAPADAQKPALAATGAQPLTVLPVGLVLIGAGALLTVVVRVGRRGYPN